jgi:acyl-CoA synthetase (AMP-forming)/AMP-acid ligase II
VGLRPQIWREFVTRFNIPAIREFYGSTEGTYGTINIRSKEVQTLGHNLLSVILILINGPAP